MRLSYLLLATAMFGMSFSIVSAGAQTSNKTRLAQNQPTRCQVHRVVTSQCFPNGNQWQIWTRAGGCTGYWSCNNPGITSCGDDRCN